jgi:hypothetical protein
MVRRMYAFFTGRLHHIIAYHSNLIGLLLHRRKIGMSHPDPLSILMERRVKSLLSA